MREHTRGEWLFASASRYVVHRDFGVTLLRHSASRERMHRELNAREIIPTGRTGDHHELPILDITANAERRVYDYE